MPARLAAVLGLAAGLAQGARVARKVDRQMKAARSKFVAGVPVLNYHNAFEGETSLAKTENLQQDWTVVVNPGVSDEQIKALCEMRNCKAVGHPSRGGVPYFEVSCTEAELEELLHQAKGAAKYVEPDSVIYAVPELDASAAASWGLDRIGTSQRSATGAGVHVYVLDTGIRASHSDFTGRVVPTVDNTKPAGSRECASWPNPMECAWDKQGHGTHCAGTAAGASYGVAPGATIHAAKVLSDLGFGQNSWTVDALDWIAAFGERPAVASLSLGAAGNSQADKDATDAAVAAGVTVVVAAGNENSDACGYSPAFVPSAITIGSTDSVDARSYFSNYGRCVDFWAPGSAITSAAHTSDSGSATFSGTSMACPHVSGAAALYLQRNTGANSAKVLSGLSSASATGVISDLTAADTNELLQVGGF